MNNYDYVIVGAGAAGPVIASRLSQNPHVSVLILEAGGENTNDISRSPGAFYKVWGTDYDWKYETTPQKNLNGRSIYMPRGRVVGGSTGINVGFWMRGTKEDYDSWEALGARGWNYDKALTLFHKIEDTNLGPNEYRGKGGMVHLEDSAFPSDFTYTQLQTFEDAGLGTLGDFNGCDSHRAAIVQKDFIDNVRHTPADSYLSPSVRKRPNLTVQAQTFVRKIVMKDKRAVGVEAEYEGHTHRIDAHKEVILCAGVFNTPQLLMLSGIGPAKHLAEQGISLVSEVPGVGENLHDHLSVEVKCLASRGVNIKGTHFDQGSKESIDEWRRYHSGPATYFPGPAAGLLASDHSSAAPNIELVFIYQSRANGSEKEFAGVADLETRSGFSIFTGLLVPKSRGNMVLASPDPHDKPLINPAYLEDSDDLEVFIKGIRCAQAAAQTPLMNPYRELMHPSLNASDQELKEMVRQEATSVYHPVGTARMGDLEADRLAVVDAHLRVRGVKGLRVADASIMPRVIRGHTMSPTVFIGEMAAEIIQSES